MYNVQNRAAKLNKKNCWDDTAAQCTQAETDPSLPGDLPHDGGGLASTRLAVAKQATEVASKDVVYHPGKAERGAWSRDQHKGIVFREFLRLFAIIW